MKNTYSTIRLRFALLLLALLLIGYRNTFAQNIEFQPATGGEILLQDASGIDALRVGSAGNLHIGTALGGYDLTLSQGAAGQILVAGAGGTSSWVAFPGATATGAVGQVGVFSGANTFIGNNGLFWDDMNMRLGIGTSTPTVALDVLGDVKATNVAFGGTLSVSSTADFSGSANFAGGASLNTGLSSFFLPTTRGTSGQVLTASLGGATGWSTVTVPNVGGFAGQVAFFNGTTSLTGNNLYWDDTNSRLGIGNPSPAEALDVQGNAAFSGNIATFGKISVTAGAGNPAIDVNSGTTTLKLTNVGGTLNVSGNTNLDVGPTFGVSSTSYSFPSARGTNGQVLKSDAAGNLSWQSPYALPTATTGGVPFYNVGGTDLSSNPGLFLWDNVNARLGVGTNTPTQRLDVSGNIRFSGALMPNGAAGTVGDVLVSTGAGSPPTWGTPAGDNLGSHTATQKLDLSGFALVGNGGTNGLSLSSAGNATIGTSSTLTDRLVVSTTTNNDGISIDNSASNFSFLRFYEGSTAVRGLISVRNNASTGMNISSTALAFSTGSGSYSERMRIDNAGNVGIANVFPSEKLDVTGNIKASGSGVFGGTLAVAGNTTLAGTTTFNGVGNTFTLPGNRGSSGQFLQTNGSSGTSWATAYTLPSAAPNGVPFYNAGGTDLSSNASFFAWDNTNKRLGVGISVPTQTLDVAGTTKTTNLQVTGNTPSAGAVLTATNAAGNTTWLTQVLGTTGQVAFFTSTNTVNSSTSLNWDDTNNRLGIGTQTPAQKLSVAGSAEVSGNYTYAAAQTRKVMISQASFSQATATQAFEIRRQYAGTPSVPYSVYAYSLTSVVSDLIAPIQVPDGCTITGINWYVFDNYAVYNPQLLLIEADSGTPAAIATITSATKSGLVQTLSSTTLSYLVDNDIKALFLLFKTDAVANTNIKTYRVVITYTVSKAD